MVTLAGPGGATVRGTCWSASADGSVLVGTTSYNGHQVPFRWTAATGMQILNTAPLRTLGNGYGVSDDGLVAVGEGEMAAPNAGFVWDAVNGYRDLPPAPGTTGGLVGAISGDGRYAFGSTQLGADGQFTRWDLSTGAIDSLPLHDGAGSPLTGLVWDCNHDGSIVVGYGSDGVQGGGLRALMWTSTGLEYMGGLNGAAFRVSDTGQTVVGHARINGPSEAFMWTPALGAVGLKQYLHDFHGLDLPDVELSHAYGVSADGRTMAGWGSPTDWVVRLPAARSSDFNRDELVDFVDLADYLNCFDGTHLLPPSSADLNRDGITDFFDLIEFLDDFER